jgi:hypothetical protein
MSYELVSVTYAWNDTPNEKRHGIICVGDGSHLDEYQDEEIFFYVRDNQELALLTYPDNGEDFIVLDVE